MTENEEALIHARARRIVREAKKEGASDTDLIEKIAAALAAQHARGRKEAAGDFAAAYARSTGSPVRSRFKAFIDENFDAAF